MAHISPDFKTKKAFKAAVANGENILLFQPGGIFPLAGGTEHVVEAPADYHKWYARVRIDVDTKRVVKVLS